MSYSYGYSVFQDVGAILGNLAENFKKCFSKCDKLVEEKNLLKFADDTRAGHLVQSEQPGAANAQNC